MDDLMSLLDGLNLQDVQESIAQRKRELKALNKLLAVARALEQGGGARKPAKCGTRSGMQEKIAAYLEASGPTGLGAIARGLGVHHKSVEAVLRQSEIFDVDEEGTWSLKTQGS